jgi:hypothetical protein
MESQERIHAFLGTDKDKDGGGMTLPAIFGPIMEHLLDKGETRVRDVLTKIERGHPGGIFRIRTIFGSTENCIEQAFCYLLERGLAVNRPRNGEMCIDHSNALIAGRAHEIFTEKQHGVSIKIDLQTAEEREKRFQEDRRNMLIREWLHDMQITNMLAGFRSINENGRLKAGIERGWRAQSFVVLDDCGYVIDGKRRVIAANELGVTIPEDKIRVNQYESDEDRLIHAWKLNKGSKWVNEGTPDCDKAFTEQRLRFLGIDPDKEIKFIKIKRKPRVFVNAEELKQEKPRDHVIRKWKGSKAFDELYDDPYQANKIIAAKAGVKEFTVDQARRKMEGYSIIPVTTRDASSRRTVYAKVVRTCDSHSAQEVLELITYLTEQYLPKRVAIAELLKGPLAVEDKEQRGIAIKEALRMDEEELVGEEELSTEDNNRNINEERIIISESS